MSTRVPPSLETAAARSWRVIVVGIPVYVGLQLVIRLWPVTLAIGVALLLTALLEPPTDWIAERGLPRLPATLATYLTSLLGLVGLGWWLVPRVIDELQGLRPAADDALQDARDWLIDGPLGLDPREVDDLRDEIVNLIPGFSSTGSDESQQGSAIVTGGIVAVEVLALVLFTLVLAFFLTKDGDRIVGGSATSSAPGPANGCNMPVQQRGARSPATSGVSPSSPPATASPRASPTPSSACRCSWPSPSSGSFFSFVPIVAAVTAGALAALIALGAGGLTDALLVVAAAIEQIEGSFFEPVVIGRSVKLQAAVVLVAVTEGALLAGVVGALVAVPITAVLAAALGAMAAETPPHERSEAAV